MNRKGLQNEGVAIKQEIGVLRYILGTEIFYIFSIILTWNNEYIMKSRLAL